MARQIICVCENMQKHSFAGKRTTGSLGTNLQSIQSIKWYGFIKKNVSKGFTWSTYEIGDHVSKVMFVSNAQAVMNELACQRRSLQTSRPGRTWKSGYTYKTVNLVFGLSVLPAQLCQLWVVTKTAQIYFSTRLTTAIDEGRLRWFVRWLADLLLSHGCRICLFPLDYTSSSDMLKLLVCFCACIFNLTKASCGKTTTHRWLWHSQCSLRPKNAVNVMFTQLIKINK